MTKNFNDILDGSVKFGDSQRVCFEKGFEAGQQSKQAEVGELKKRIDRVAHILTYTNHASTPLCNELREILKGNSHES